MDPLDGTSSRCFPRSILPSSYKRGKGARVNLIKKNKYECEGIYYEFIQLSMNSHAMVFDFRACTSLFLVSQ